MFFDNIRMALAELKANKMRSLLTMLGIVIGISSVITIVTIGDAIKNSVNDLIGSNTSNTIWVDLIQQGMSDYNDERNRDDDARPISNKDYINKDMLDGISEKFGDRIKGFGLIQYLGWGYSGEDQLYIYGLTNSQFSEKMIAGRMITSKEQQNAGKVILISKQFANKLYDSPENAVGKQVEIDLGGKLVNFTIVGVYGQKTEGVMNSVFGTPNVYCYVPLATAINIEKGKDFDLDEALADTGFDYVSIVAKEGTDIDSLKNELESYINNTFYSNNDTYKAGLSSFTDESQEAFQVFDYIKLAIAAIAAIALFVGCIGVMNIMIVSVTERTREIGTRKALGATNREIKTQFLLEALVICVIGSLIGIVLGTAGGYAVSSVMKVHATPSFGAMVISVLVSMLFGLFFGYYPAKRAAELNPIEALRYE